ncbi:uncharacterized protein LOC144618675 [Crassostrea virginica]
MCGQFYFILSILNAVHQIRFFTKICKTYQVMTTIFAVELEVRLYRHFIQYQPSLISFRGRRCEGNTMNPLSRKSLYPRGLRHQRLKHILTMSLSQRRPCLDVFRAFCCDFKNAKTLGGQSGLYEIGFR